MSYMKSFRHLSPDRARISTCCVLKLNPCSHGRARMTHAASDCSSRRSERSPLPFRETQRPTQAVTRPLTSDVITNLMKTRLPPQSKTRACVWIYMICMYIHTHTYIVTPLNLPPIISCVNSVVFCWFAHNRVLRSDVFTRPPAQSC